MSSTTCELCNCPLTILKTMFGRPEPRAKCARCADEGALSWKPPKAIRTVGANELSMRKGRVPRKKELH